MVVVDTFYPNNTGGYTRDDGSICPAVPEPAAIWLAFSGFAVLGLPRAFRRCRVRDNYRFGLRPHATGS